MAESETPELVRATHEALVRFILHALDPTHTFWVNALLILVGWGSNIFSQDHHLCYIDCQAVHAAGTP